jgi:hypothetical protein
MSTITVAPTTFTWHPIDGDAVVVSLYRHPGPANQRRCVVDGKTVGYVWQRNVNGYRAVWSYRLEADTLGMVRGSCRDRDEAVSRLMFAVRATETATAAATVTTFDGSGPVVCGNTGQ